MFLKNHGVLERHSLLLTVCILLAVSVGGIVQIAPLFRVEQTIETVDGVRPYTPLELAGRRIYVREGCYTCHSQMIRPLRDEIERYGHYSLAAESMYDHPFQWGSKRTGPDLARVGGRYSDAWQVQHLVDPRSVVPDSIMPPYAFLADKPLGPLADTIGNHVLANVRVGVPYTQAAIDNAKADLLAQADPNADTGGLTERYGERVNIRDFDGNPGAVTEMDALVAYLQVLGTMVDFSTYEPERGNNLR
jgi:cytochrome c oxidase cbb3-type subunit II